MYPHAWLILILPMLGFIFLSWYGKRVSKTVAGFIGCATIGVAFLITLTLLAGLLISDPAERVGNVQVAYSWLNMQTFHLDLAILVDPLSVFMLLVITGVGFLIHVYSVGYMSEDPEYARFFSYMNFFIFSMSLLVLAADFFFLIVGWAMVGLASYLLIGFWTHKTSAVLAARKAFVMNVIGDVGMVIAAFMIYDHFGSISYAEVFSAAPAKFMANDVDILLITLFLLVGAFAKSAQIPLHTWLPDAMEGPTPVSALIHAATMVTAGVYLIARCNVLYMLAPYTLFLIASVGVLTALFAGAMGMVQYDIKRVIAYSTMSQLGYMFLAVGVGVFSVGMFHLMTHAFFKALLFLGAGSVIHSLHEEQDIRKMGGLARPMPITFATFLIASLALTAFPLTAGFYSKDAIIMHSYFSEYGNFVFWGLALLGAGMTGFYTFRLFFYTFLGKSRSPEAHPHESPWVMVVPLMILAFLSLFAGHLAGWVNEFLAPVFGGHVPHAPHDSIMEATAITVSLLGIVSAIGLYLTGKNQLEFVKTVGAPLYDLMLNKFYIDELYNFFITKPMRVIGKFFEQRAEREGIDFAIDMVGDQVREVSRQISVLQSGKVRWYAFNTVAGLILVLVFVIFL